jgi:hypothetical protein
MQTLIHVRFSPDGTVTEIGARPQGVDAQLWFNHLTRTAGNAYQALSGGRGVFRVAPQDLDGIKAALAK